MYFAALGYPISKDIITVGQHIGVMLNILEAILDKPKDKLKIIPLSIKILVKNMYGKTEGISLYKNKSTLVLIDSTTICELNNI